MLFCKYIPCQQFNGSFVKMEKERTAHLCIVFLKLFNLVLAVQILNRFPCVFLLGLVAWQHGRLRVTIEDSPTFPFDEVLSLSLDNFLVQNSLNLIGLSFASAAVRHPELLARACLKCY